MKVGIEVVTGFLGAGKSAFINSLIKTTKAVGEKIIVLTCEIGNVKIKEFKEKDLFVKHINFMEDNAELDKNIYEIINEYKPHRIIIEYNGTETLEYLYDKYRLVIATNGPILAVEAKLKKIDCLQFIDSIFSTDMADNAAAKPDKDFFRQLKDYLNFYDDDKILIIGDSLYSDVLGGMNCGIDTCWFNRKNDVLLDKYKPTMTITNLKQLIKKL